MKNQNQVRRNNTSENPVSQVQKRQSASKQPKSNRAAVTMQPGKQGQGNVQDGAALSIPTIEALTNPAAGNIDGSASNITRSQTCLLVAGPNNEEWCRIDLDSDLYESVRKCAQEDRVLVNTFINRAIRERVNNYPQLQSLRDAVAEARHAISKAVALIDNQKLKLMEQVQDEGNPDLAAYILGGTANLANDTSSSLVSAFNAINEVCFYISTSIRPQEGGAQ